METGLASDEWAKIVDHMEDVSERLTKKVKDHAHEVHVLKVEIESLKARIKSLSQRYE